MEIWMPLAILATFLAVAIPFGIVILVGRGKTGVPIPPPKGDIQNAITAIAFYTGRTAKAKENADGSVTITILPEG